MLDIKVKDSKFKLDKLKNTIYVPVPISENIRANLSTQTNININKYAFSIDELSDKLYQLKNKYNQDLLKEFKVYKTMTSSVNYPSAETFKENCIFNQRELVSNSTCNFVLMRGVFQIGRK